MFSLCMQLGLALMRITIAIVHSLPKELTCMIQGARLQNHTSLRLQGLII